MRDLMTATQIGTLIGRTGRTVRILSEKHGIAAAKLSGRQKYWTRGSVTKFISALADHPVGRPKKEKR